MYVEPSKRIAQLEGEVQDLLSELEKKNLKIQELEKLLEESVKNTQEMLDTLRSMLLTAPRTE